MDKLTIVKVGGKILNDSALLEQFIAQFAKIKGSKLIVHGGGKEATDVLTQMGIKTNFVDGRRITDIESLKVIAMVYAGWVNKSLVTKLQAAHINAIGLSGADGNAILSEKRKGSKIDFGYVGDILKVNSELLMGLLQMGLTPVMCPLTHDDQGQLLNTNADGIAAKVATALSEKCQISLRYCFEFDGVLRDKSDPTSIIEKLDEHTIETLKKDGTIADGMIPKVDNAMQAKKSNLHEVIICGITNLVSKDKATVFYG